MMKINDDSNTLIRYIYIREIFPDSAHTLQHVHMMRPKMKDTSFTFRLKVSTSQSFQMNIIPCSICRVLLNLN